MKLVYADDLLYYVDALLDRHHAPAIGGLALHKIVDRMKGIDAVPVVRCTDCKNWERLLFDADYGCYCPFVDRYTTGDWYCANGERKDNV